ncbi:uncharacterized protein SAPINGB_P006147 [Magnusiomyces paraingens]|uniref:Uncharacterized protein n=1 Tax=Magnusiomyces paraingens TaxID=2606893 RepID=A0A5E8C5H3_9ASCO|nr:uncharacterized protein SAPINGB_P006147 [Saprochaete ingens]VVT58320.1 unnamed protein product [Saprochaete ingens]
MSDDFSDHPNAKRIVIISGGTASNSLVSTFSSLSPHISYLLPISDNGGSTSELIRVVGGPAIGDLRSRITRLIPEKSTALRSLLSYRLPEDSLGAKSEWTAIVEGTHPLWFHVQSQFKELIRPFFIHVHVELLKRSRPGREFRFEKANVGNLFLTGARLFCGSLDSAIELFLRITLVPSTIAVLPALNTNFSHHISAQLQNGEIITGQSQISHPSANHLTPVKDVPYAHIVKQNAENNHPLSFSLTSSAGTPISSSSSPPYGSSDAISTSDFPDESESSPGLTITLPPRFTYNTIDTTNNNESSSQPSPDHDQEDAHLPFSHPDLKISQLHFHKDENIPLASPIRRIFYINPYGQEIHPRASSRVIRTLEEADVIIYSIGSLFTSTIPVVILQGFASSIQDNAHLKKKKILLLNGSKDRETDSLDALDFVRALVGACLYSELGGKSSIYNHFNYSGSSIALNHMSKQQQIKHHQTQAPSRDFSASNYTTTSSHAQDILMRPTPRLTKAYNPSGTSNLMLGPDYDNNHSLGVSNSYHSINNSSTNLMYASDQDIDDVYNSEKIDKATWSKYITHIVYLESSQFCPSAAALKVFQSKGIKCYALQPYSKDNSNYKYSSDSLKGLLTVLVND